MQRVLTFDGLYGETTPRPGREHLYSERLETRSKLFNWLIQPHLHTALYQLFWLETGAVTFTDAAQQRHLLSPVLLLVPPGALHGLAYSPDATGHILTLSDTLVRSLFPAASPLAPLLGGVQCLHCFEAPYLPAAISQLIAQLDEELFAERPEKSAMLHLLLQHLFTVLYRLWRPTEQPAAGVSRTNVHYFRQFQQRLPQVGGAYSLAQLAAELGITPTHLNRVCHAVAGKPASQLAQEHLLAEACKYLTYTSYPVTEIASRLQFAYPNYFAKFFRKHTGLSPSEYRAAKG